MKRIQKKLWFGILVAAGIILFITGIFFIGRKEDLYVPTIHVHAVFSEINGLTEGNFVRYAGARVGVVEKITFLNDTTILVDMKIEKRMQPFIMEDDLVYIATEGLVGNKLINISAGRKSRKMVADGAALQAVEPFNTQAIIENLVNTNENATRISASLATLSERLNANKGIFETVVSDTSAAADLKDIIANVKLTSIRLNELSGRFEKISETLNLNEGMAGSLLTDTSLVDDLTTTMSNLKQSSAYADSLMSKLASGEQNQQSTIGMLMSDSAFAENLRQSVINLKQGSAKLDENMEALQHSLLLRRYFRKKKQQENSGQ